MFWGHASSGTPSGCIIFIRQSGAIAALNPRLLSGIPVRSTRPPRCRSGRYQDCLPVTTLSGSNVICNGTMDMAIPMIYNRLWRSIWPFPSACMRHKFSHRRPLNRKPGLQRGVFGGGGLPSIALPSTVLMRWTVIGMPMAGPSIPPEYRLLYKLNGAECIVLYGYSQSLYTAFA